MVLGLCIYKEIFARKHTATHKPTSAQPLIVTTMTHIHLTRALVAVEPRRPPIKGSVEWSRHEQHFCSLLPYFLLSWLQIFQLCLSFRTSSLIWFFCKNSFGKMKNIWKTTENALAPSIFIVLSIRAETWYTASTYPSAKYQECIRTEYATPDLFTMGHWHGEISSNVTFAYCTKGCIDVAVLRGWPLTHARSLSMQNLNPFLYFFFTKVRREVA